ncbi:alcohol dehydrogenase catalytic domain-containing protein, partial [Nonomuraea sp. NPDC049784]|uniref:alcohol dehydrogenase catalytic domain-containing protein n=1 Tax=Nonomuraea sp. NPDC049784 TaxID=3154361 RepID=UPI0033E7DAA8
MNATEMRAALFDQYGPPEVLYVGTVPKPVPGPGEVLVRVHAASVNGGELHGRAGKMRPVTGLMQRGFPKRMGLDFTGEVVALGPDPAEPGPRLGDRVWGVLDRTFGSVAEYQVGRAAGLRVPRIECPGSGQPGDQALRGS